MTQLRRGRGLHWCPAGAHYVGESQMMITDPLTFERSKLLACRTCQLSSSKANSKARAVAAAGRCM